MAQYKICPDCGAHLDSYEICDCGSTGYKPEEKAGSKTDEIFFGEEEHSVRSEV